MIEGEPVDVNTTNSPQFCRLKSSVGSLKLTCGQQPIMIHWHQIYIAVWDKQGIFHIFQNGVLYSLFAHHDYFEFYDATDDVWYNDEDTVLSEVG